MTYVSIFKRKRWSPWITGALTGFIAALCILLSGKSLGASGGFESMASIIASAIGIVPGNSVYFRNIKPPVVDFQMIMFIGIIAGAALSSVFSGDFKLRALPDNEWKERFGTGKIKRFTLLFLGCVIMAIGAGLAGGCTSGLGISGIMQLSPTGLLFVAGVFLSGIITVFLIRRRLL